MLVTLVRHIRLFATPRTVAHQVSLFMEFSRQEYWNRLPIPSPGNLPDAGVRLQSPTLYAGSLQSEIQHLTVNT